MGLHRPEWFAWGNQPWQFHCIVPPGSVWSDHVFRSCRPSHHHRVQEQWSGHGTTSLTPVRGVSSPHAWFRVVQRWYQVRPLARLFPPLLFSPLNRGSLENDLSSSSTLLLKRITLHNPHKSRWSHQTRQSQHGQGWRRQSLSVLGMLKKVQRMELLPLSQLRASTQLRHQ